MVALLLLSKCSAMCAYVSYLYMRDIGHLGVVPYPMAYSALPLSLH